MKNFPRIWLFDINRRIYPKAEPGRLWASGGPIYREHWMEHEVVGETRVSWITKYGAKVSKKGGYGIAFSEAEVDDDVWVHGHRAKISDAVGRLKDAAKLRQIADIAGVEP